MRVCRRIGIPQTSGAIRLTGSTVEIAKPNYGRSELLDDDDYPPFQVASG